jgi:hypothetical protein
MVPPGALVTQVPPTQVPPAWQGAAVLQQPWPIAPHPTCAAARLTQQALSNTVPNKKIRLIARPLASLRPSPPVSGNRRLWRPVIGVHGNRARCGLLDSLRSHGLSHLRRSTSLSGQKPSQA